MLVLPKTCNMYIFSDPPDRALAHKYHFYCRPITQLRATEPRSIHVDPAQRNVEYFLEQLYLNAGASRVSNHGTYEKECNAKFSVSSTCPCFPPTAWKIGLQE